MCTRPNQCPLLLLLMLLISLLLFSGCPSSDNDSSDSDTSSKYSSKEPSTNSSSSESSAESSTQSSDESSTQSSTESSNTENKPTEPATNASSTPRRMIQSESSYSKAMRAYLPASPSPEQYGFNAEAIREAFQRWDATVANVRNQLGQTDPEAARLYQQRINNYLNVQNQQSQEALRRENARSRVMDQWYQQEMQRQERIQQRIRDGAFSYGN